MTTPHTRAVARYNAKTYDQVKINVPKGWREKVQAAAAGIGESMTQYMAYATLKRMEGEIMKKYRIVDNLGMWLGNQPPTDENTIIDEKELARLANEWGKDAKDLLQDLEEI